MASSGRTGSAVRGRSALPRRAYRWPRTRRTGFSTSSIGPTPKRKSSSRHRLPSRDRRLALSWRLHRRGRRVPIDGRSKGGGHEVTSKRVHVVGGDGTGADPGCRRHRSGEAVVAVPGRGPRSALRYGGQEDQESVHSAPARGEEVEHLRLVPAHEGRLLDRGRLRRRRRVETARGQDAAVYRRSEEHTSELQSLRHLVCRLLLEKKK